MVTPLATLLDLARLTDLERAIVRALDASPRAGASAELAAHKARDIDGTDAAQAELTALSAEAVEIQCAELRRAQGAA